MASPEAMLAFTLVSIPLILVSGPSVLFVIGRTLSLIGRALSLNRIGALPSVVDTALGSLVAGLAVPFGVGLVVQQSVVLFTVLKFAGGLYLGVQAIRHRNPAADADARRIVVRSKLRLLREGFAMGVTHPKTILFPIAVLHQFVDRAGGGVPAQMASVA
ncbi:MAG: LysE family translocator, partial [Microbacteriaceae bacterium]|nr:LysE family translocator [Microbacteriaceae bacterium]